MSIPRSGMSTRLELVGAFRKMLIDRQADLKPVVVRTRTEGDP